MEKEHQPDSMATMIMKPDYPPSEVYSASEPPPAYRHRGSTSVQIARIVALTVVASSFILGSFILASSWVSARSSCHQLEQLDAMLEKELALEGRAYGNDALLADEPLPIGNAHALRSAPLPLEAAPPRAPAPSPASQVKEDALHQAESKLDEEKLQKIDDTPSKTDAASDSDESSESDGSSEDEDELDRPVIKLPIQFDLDELAGAFLSSSQKGRMNCVVERRNEEPMERRFPFNILGAFAPRASHAERVAIICHGGDEPRSAFPEPQSQVFAFPLTGPVRLPLRPQPAPPARPAFPPMQHRNMPFPLPMPWDSSEEQQQGGNPREMRIHVQRVIAIPTPHNMPPRDMPPRDDGMGSFAPPPPPPQHEQNEQNAGPQMHQFVPQPAPVQDMEQPEQLPKMSTNVNMGLPWGLTPEDLRLIQRTADDALAGQRREQIDNDMQEVKTIVSQLAAAEAEAEAEEQRQPRMEEHRTLLLPQQMPQQMQQQMPQQMPQQMQEDEPRPHFVQPRSVRSADFAPSKRIKRSLSCNCQ